MQCSNIRIPLRDRNITPPFEKACPQALPIGALSSSCTVVVVLQAEAAIVGGMLQAEQQLSMVRCRQSSNGRIGHAAGRAAEGLQLQAKQQSVRVAVRCKRQGMIAGQA